MMKVSVIIPTYNAVKYIRACLDSVLQQTMSDLEVIIVDDESPDGSITLIKNNYNDPRIRIIRQKNRGLSGARNTGIRNAKGDFIAMLDADDFWDETKLEKHLALFATDKKIGITYSQSQFMDDDSNKINLQQTPKLAHITFRDIICRNPIGNGSAPVFRRAVLKEIEFINKTHGETAYFDESFRQSEDIECWIRIAATTDWDFAGIGEPLTWYRINADGLSANLEAQFESWQRAIDKTKTYAPKLIKQWGRLAKAYQYRYLARRAIQSRNKKSAIKLLIKALISHPKILIEEPKRTISTILATVLIAILPLSWYEFLEQKTINSNTKFLQKK